MNDDEDGPYAFAYQCTVCDTVCESAPARSLALRNYRTHYWAEHQPVTGRMPKRVEMARTAGVEPARDGLTGRCSAN